MKSIQKLLIFIFLPLFFSCTDDFEPEFDLETTLDYRINTSQQNNGPAKVSTSASVPIYSQKSLIIQYVTGLSEADKVEFRNRHTPQGGIMNVKTCHCTEQDIERWTFSGNIQIEPKKQTIEDDPLGNGKLRAVNRDFYFATDFGPKSGSGSASYDSHIKYGNSGVTIAILDTGFDPTFSVFDDDFGNPIEMLYDATHMGMAVGEETSGWNFVDDNDNTFDDNLGKHGTAISYLFHEILSSGSDPTPYQILPLKVFDKYGNGNFFSFLCASRYAFERADVVQMSFGWLEGEFEEDDDNIFLNLVDDFSDVLVVTSAGNSDPYGDPNNNDFIGHYPSSYDRNKIVAVAATNSDKTNIASFSNYGGYSVDFFALGEDIEFYNADGSPLEHDLDGTSFAAPQVAAMGAIIKADLPSDSPLITLLNMLILSGESIDDDYYEDYDVEKPVKYNKLINTVIE